MSMTFEEQAEAVRALTAASLENPRRYRTRVVAWISLGYLLIAGLLALSLLLSVGVIAGIAAIRAWVLLKLAWIPVVFSWILARALFGRLEPPSGRALEPHEAPRLFAMIEEIRVHTGVPRLDGVLIVTDMNASVTETPRFGGLFGWRRHLTIGLPLLISSSADEMKAILGHELGHLSAQHGRIAAWSWRVRVTWSRVLDSVDAQSGSVAGMLQKLVHWYFDHLMPVTLVQARHQEHAADDFARELTSRETAARALASLAVATELMDVRFWKPLTERTATEPEPPKDVLRDALRRRAEVFGAPYDHVLANALARHTALDDTHPSLAERLRHLGVEHPALDTSAASALEELFGPTAQTLLDEHDRHWYDGVAEGWRARHQQLAEAQKVLAEPDAADDESLFARATSLSNLGRDDEAFPIYEQILERKPSEARAAFQLGRILVQRGDLRGLDHLSRAMKHDWRYGVASCELAYGALREQGLEKDAHAWAGRYRQECARANEVQRESEMLALDDDLVASDLAPDTQDLILARCRDAKWVGKVWLLRKVLTAAPVSVNIVAVRAKTFRPSGRKRVERLIESFGPLEQSVMVFVVENRALMRGLDEVPTARRFWD